MGPDSCALSTMVTEELMVIGAACAGVGADAAERPSTTMKGMEEARDETRREIGIWLPRTDPAKAWIFFASRIIHLDAVRCRPGWASSLDATVVWFPESFLRFCLLSGFRVLLVSVLVLLSA